MINHEWTEKQIAKAIAKVKESNKPLKVADIRSGNRYGGHKIESSDWRRLMRILVDRGHAFDNGESWENYRYEISTQPLPRFFSEDLLPKLVNIPHVRYVVDEQGIAELEDLLGRQITEDDLIAWGLTTTKWSLIRTALWNLQCSRKLDVEMLELGDLPDRIAHWNKALLVQEAKTLVYMYQAIKSGWREIKQLTKDLELSSVCSWEDSDKAFLTLLGKYAFEDFLVRCFQPLNFNPSPHSAFSRHTRSINSKYKTLKELSVDPRDYSKDERLGNTEAYNNYNLNEDFRNASRLLRSNKKACSDRFREILDSPYASLESHTRLTLLESSEPEVKAKAEQWEESMLKAGSLSAGFIRRRVLKTSLIE